MSAPPQAPAVPARGAGRRQGGPPPLAPALAFGALTVAAAIALAGGPRPGSSAASALDYARSHTGLLHAAALLIFGAAVPLAIWAATIYRRLRTALGVTAPGAVVGLAGGILAAASLAVSGLVTWTIAESAGVASPALARVLFSLAFAAGAAGFAVPLALLLAGVAVPALILGLVPRPFAWAGLAIAAVGMVSTLTLVTPALDVTLPVARFGGLAWMIAASLLLPANRHQIRPAASS
jgi:hypothetical protein